jgi:hypothetical protein
MGRKVVVLAVFLVGVLVGIPVAVLAAGGGKEGGLNRQGFRFRLGPAISTSSSQFRPIPGLLRLTCSRGTVAVTVSVNVTGAPLDVRAVIDSGKPMEPRIAHFDPAGTTSFSYTFVDSVGPFEASNGHTYSVQWRSPTGGSVTLRRADMLVQYRDPHTCR